MVSLRILTTTPPRANKSWQHMGPHLSSIVHLPTESLHITGESDPDKANTASYLGAQTPENHADSSPGVGRSKISIEPKLRTTKEWLNRHISKTLNFKPGKYPENESL